MYLEHVGATNKTIRNQIKGIGALSIRVQMAGHMKSHSNAYEPCWDKTTPEAKPKPCDSWDTYVGKLAIGATSATPGAFMSPLEVLAIAVKWNIPIAIHQREAITRVYNQRSTKRAPWYHL